MYVVSYPEMSGEVRWEWGGNSLINSLTFAMASSSRGIWRDTWSSPDCYWWRRNIWTAPHRVRTQKPVHESCPHPFDISHRDGWEFRTQPHTMPCYLQAMCICLLVRPGLDDKLRPRFPQRKIPSLPKFSRPQKPLNVGKPETIYPPPTAHFS